MNPVNDARITRWHLLTISLLFLGYGGYYFCRSDYSVALPLLIAEQAHKGIPAGIAQIRLGSIASLGVSTTSASGTFSRQPRASSTHSTR